jgi:chromate transporter
VSSRENNVLRQLFLSFLRIGAFSFGGGYAMLPLIRREVIDRHRWVSDKDFLELLTLAQSAPGPVSLNVAVFVGYARRGYAGALAAVMGVVLPAFVVILLIVIFFAGGASENRAVEAVFRGMRPAVVALMVAPLLGLSRGLGLYRIGLAVIVAAVVWRLGVSPAWLLLAGAACGIGWRLRHERRRTRGPL